MKMLIFLAMRLYFCSGRWPVSTWYVHPLYGRGTHASHQNGVWFRRIVKLKQLMPRPSVNQKLYLNWTHSLCASLAKTLYTLTRWVIERRRIEIYSFCWCGVGCVYQDVAKLSALSLIIMNVCVHYGWVFPTQIKK